MQSRRGRRSRSLACFQSSLPNPYGMVSVQTARTRCSHFKTGWAWHRWVPGPVVMGGEGSVLLCSGCCMRASIPCTGWLPAVLRAPAATSLARREPTAQTLLRRPSSAAALLPPPALPATATASSPLGRFFLFPWPVLQDIFCCCGAALGFTCPLPPVHFSSRVSLLCAAGHLLPLRRRLLLQLQGGSAPARGLRDRAPLDGA